MPEKQITCKFCNKKDEFEVYKWVPYNQSEDVTYIVQCKCGWIFEIDP